MSSNTSASRIRSHSRSATPAATVPDVSGRITINSSPP
jgi:hypothetical protein